jgi:DNA-binding NarL/FixJ family response regulator
MLETEAESVLMVTDGVSLMRALERTVPDLVVADISLPITGERNVVRLIKQQHPEIRIIIVSVHDEGTVLKEVMQAGAEGFVLKRRAVIDLIPAIRQVCEGGRFVSPDMETYDNAKGG